MKDFDKSQEPVTSFPAKIDKSSTDEPDENIAKQQEVRDQISFREDDTFPKEEIPISDLSSWNDSAPSSPLPEMESNLTKSKVSNYYHTHMHQYFVFLGYI